MHSERQNERESGSKKVYKLSFQFTSEISPMHSERVKVRKTVNRKKFTSFLQLFRQKSQQCTVRGTQKKVHKLFGQNRRKSPHRAVNGFVCSRQRGNADADIPFPLIKETRPLPLWDAEVIRTYFEEREVSV